MRVFEKLLPEIDDEAGAIYFVWLAGYLNDDWMSKYIKKI